MTGPHPAQAGRRLDPLHRVETWAVPDEDWPGWWHVIVGVHQAGRYREHLLTGQGSLLPEETCSVLHRLHADLTPDGRILNLSLDPETFL